MPKMAGRALAKRLARIRPDTPVALWSVLAFRDVEEGITTTCPLKPFTFKEKGTDIQTALDKHPHLSC
jgi:hypothetical protein